MASVPSGTTYSIATVFATAKPVSAISNAAEASVSCTAHGFTVGDYLQIFSGWSRLNRRVIKVKSVTTDAFVAEKIDTSSTSLYEPGAGAGSVRKITTFVPVSKILNQSSSGGEAKNITFKYLESDVEENAHDGFTAIAETFEIDADEFGLASYNALVSLTDVQTDTVLKKTLKSGSLIFVPCRLAINENVKMAEGSIMTNMVSVNANGKITRY